MRFSPSHCAFAFLVLLSTAVLAAANSGLKPHSAITHTNIKPIKSGSNGFPPLNVTKSIAYDSILRSYIASKEDGERQCPRIDKRVEWRQLTYDQRGKWIKANWCLNTRPSRLVGTETALDGLRTSLLDDFSLVHIRLFYKIHHVAAFFPWHRWYIKAREHALRDCGYDGPMPYWDWAVDADTGDAQASSVLSNDYGVSGNGSLADGTITTGPFAYFPVSFRSNATNGSFPVYSPHYLQRSFGQATAHNTTFPMFEESFNSSSVERVFKESGNNFSTFTRLLEGLKDRSDIVGAGPHSGLHDGLGGDMASPYSANDPIFFLHHVNVDRLWWFWQNGDTTGRGLPSHSVNTSDLTSRFWAYTGNTAQLDLEPSGGPAASLFDFQSVQGLYLPNIETYKLMDPMRAPLCYTYT
ncbi:unnamed protein product [Tilletia controversa]|uniref:Tyrosinase copper-binding domain-containing protein n=3 Tax=Tilletia TaxID=13289 RepID=A0A8X7MT47_9BASI|nr:hypothetical protein CF336_g4034 [Tilletia laevis]KAE8197035.1 hypothetical protein CF328_g3962 [Tilletia controversa]KAE8260899.1 hypothetical protein A4X03_0g3663 [Tilletia caries]KAE8202259.1 hypothetical protein CF335_g3491 [Tilletia laevis]KAE8247133.1 hypothetical protein A4X06_0g4675 [Tilletia controversa]